jgi:hypothetical protein
VVLTARMSVTLEVPGISQMPLCGSQSSGFLFSVMFFPVCAGTLNVSSVNSMVIVGRKFGMVK